MTPAEQLRLKTQHDQEQEWTEGRTWYESMDKGIVLYMFMRVNEGTRESVNSMGNDAIAVMCRLAVLALVEIVSKSEFANE